MIKYENWPVIVRIETALRDRRFNLLRGEGMATIGYLLAIAGIVITLFSIIRNNEAEVFTDNLSLGIGCFLMGMICVISGYSISWVNKYSSWEERFNHQSLLTEKLGAILLSLIGGLGLALIIKSMN